MADKIGRAIADVARHHQVLCITHLAPIAAFAGAHFVVSKSDAGGVTRSTVVRVGKKERAAEVARMCALDAEPTDPLLSPRYAALHGLPPALIQVGSIDLLRSDGEVMAHRLGKAAVPWERQVWNGQMHAFTLLAGVLPEARAALRELGAFTARCTDRPG